MMMNKLSAGTPVDIRGLRLIPVERSSASASVMAGRLIATGAKEPVAVVVRVDGSLRAMDLEGSDIPLAGLLDDVENLAQACNDEPAGD